MTALHVDAQGTGEPVVLLHSHGLSSRQWRRLGGELGGRGMRVVAVDLTGHGASEAWPEPRPFSFELDVERVAEIVAAHPAHLVGHSYGGLIALHVARLAPRSVQTLSLYDPVAFGVLDPVADRDAWDILGRLDLAWDERERWLRTFVEFWSGPGAWQALREEARDEFRRVAWVVREGVRTLTLDRAPLSAYAELAVPTRLVTGERSPLPARRVIERLAQVLPDARHDVVARAGHMGPLTHAPDVNPLFITQLERTAS